MDKRGLWIITPFAFAGLAVAGLAQEGLLQPRWSIVLFACSVVASALFGLTIPTIHAKQKPKLTQASSMLLTFFNLLLLFSIVVEVFGLISLLEFIEVNAPSASIVVWMLPVMLSLGLALVVLERRVNSERPTLRPTAMALAGALTTFNLVIWANALLIPRFPLLFVTNLTLEAPQAVYLLILGMIIQSVAVMNLYQVPTILELAVNRQDAFSKFRAFSNASPLLVTIAFSGLVSVVGFFVALTADESGQIGAALPDDLLLRFALVVPLALLTFFVMAALLTIHRLRQRLFRTKMDPRRRLLIIIQALSALITVGLLLILFQVVRQDGFVLAGIPIGQTFTTELVVASILVATGPLGFYLHRENRRTQFMEERLSDFLADIAETSNAGLSLHASLSSATRKDYGPLNKEIRLMSHQVSWGVTFAEVFRRFAERAKTPLIRRAATLVVESSRSGGNTSDVLKAASKDVYEIKSLEAERRLAMTTYVIVIYVVFFVFLAILAILAVTFLPQLLASTDAAGGQSGLFSSGKIKPGRLENAYFNAVLVQAIGNGVVAGVIRDGQFSSGLRHVFIMVLLAYLAFRILIL